MFYFVLRLIRPTLSASRDHSSPPRHDVFLLFCLALCVFSLLWAFYLEQLLFSYFLSLQRVHVFVLNVYSHLCIQVFSILICFIFSSTKTTKFSTLLRLKIVWTHLFIYLTKILFFRSSTNERRNTPQSFDSHQLPNFRPPWLHSNDCQHRTNMNEKGWERIEEREQSPSCRAAAWVSSPFSFVSTLCACSLTVASKFSSWRVRNQIAFSVMNAVPDWKHIQMTISFSQSFWNSFVNNQTEWSFRTKMKNILRFFFTLWGFEFALLQFVMIYKVVVQTIRIKMLLAITSYRDFRRNVLNLRLHFPALIVIFSMIETSLKIFWFVKYCKNWCTLKKSFFVQKSWLIIFFISWMFWF